MSDWRCNGEEAAALASSGMDSGVAPELLAGHAAKAARANGRCRTVHVPAPDAGDGVADD